MFVLGDLRPRHADMCGVFFVRQRLDTLPLPGAAMRGQYDCQTMMFRKEGLIFICQTQTAETFDSSSGQWRPLVEVAEW